MMVKQTAKLAKATIKGEATLRHDLDRWCKAFTEMEKKTFEDDDAEFKWLNKHTEEALVTIEGVKLLQLMAASEPGQKWLVIKAAAVKDGRPDWDCPAMRKKLPPVSPAETE